MAEFIVRKGQAVSHNGKTYKEGETFKLSDGQGFDMVESGVIRAIVKGGPDPLEEIPQEETELDPVTGKPGRKRQS